MFAMFFSGFFDLLEAAVLGFFRVRSNFSCVQSRLWSQCFAKAHVNAYLTGDYGCIGIDAVHAHH